MALSTLNFTTSSPPHNGNKYCFQDISYEAKFLIYLALKAKRSNCTLRLASDIRNHGSFENFVFEYKFNGLKNFQVKFMQVKSDKIARKFRIEDYDFASYFSSYLKVRNNSEASNFEELVVCLNNELDLTPDPINDLYTFENFKDAIYLEKNSGYDNVFGLMGDRFKIVSNNSNYTNQRKTTFENIEKKITTVNPNATSIDILDFMDKLTFVTDLKESDIDDILKKELMESGLEFPRGVTDTKFIQFLRNNRNLEFHSLINSFHKPRESVLSENIFSMSAEYKKKLEQCKIEFKDISQNTLDFLDLERFEFEDRVLPITTSLCETNFAVIKVFQAIKLSKAFMNEDSFLMINTNMPEEFFRKAVDAFETDTLIKLLVVECDKLVKNYYKMENDLFEVVKNDSSKKLIIIAEKHKLEIDPNFQVEAPIEEIEQKASDLTEISLRELLNREVHFQGTSVCLGDVIEVENQALIVSLPLKDLINIEKLGENISVYKKFSENLFVERKFVYNGFQKEFRDLMSSREKLVVISDVSGSGKTELFNYIAKKLKTENPSKWIMTFDFLDYIREFQKGFSKDEIVEDDINSAIDFLTKKILKINNAVEKIIFTESLNNPEKVILLFDGFDELPGEYSILVTNLLKLLSQTSVEKIFVSTRPEIRAELEELLGQPSYKILPFNEEDQKEFWIKYCQQIKSKFDDLESVVNAKFDKISSSICNFHEFAATPMITKMIAEYFEETYNPENDVQMHDVYKKFIEKKYKHFLGKSRRDLSNVITKNYEKTLTEFLNEIHKILAFRQVFNDAQLKEINFEKNPRLFGEEVVQILKCGLVHDTKTGLKFSHPSFAEYFVVNNFLENLGKVNVAKFLISQIFVNPEHQMIRLLMNGKLKYKSEFYGRLIRNHFRGNPETDIEESLLIITIKERLFENFYFFYDAMFENMNSICFDSKKTMDLQSNLLQHMVCYTDNIKQFLDHVKTKFGLYFIKKTVRYRFERNLFQIKNLLGLMSANETSYANNLLRADGNYSKFLKWIKHNINGPFFIEEILFSNRMKGWDAVLYLLAKNGFWSTFWLYVEELELVRKAYDKKYIKHIRSLVTYEYQSSDKNGNRNLLHFITNDVAENDKFFNLVSTVLEEDDFGKPNMWLAK